MKQLLDAIPTASWAVVMGSGIVSIDLYSDRQAVLSAIMLWFAAGVWLSLAVVLGLVLAYQRDRFARAAISPASFTGVAGTVVLGTRLAIQGYRVAAAALLAVAGVGWALLLIPVLRHWKTPTAGISFVLSVATEGLAVLGATLAISYRAGWLVGAAVPALFLGLALYGFTAARFDLRELVTGHGDHWVAGGALAISALAAGKITEAAATLGQFSEQHQALTTSTLVLWCLAMVWLFPLVTGEVLRPRLTYDVRRWATVFPLGMYAACSFVTAGRCCVAGATRPLRRTGRRSRRALHSSPVPHAAGAITANPAGRVHHSCFGPDDALMVYEVRESQQAFEEYGPVLMPILHKAGIDPGTPDVMPVHNLAS